MRRLFLATILIGMAVPAVAQAPDLSGSNVIATGSSSARSLAAMAADLINVRNWGAVGNTNSDRPNITISSGSALLTVSSSIFATTDVGKAISIDGAGATSTTGVVASIPVTAAGSAYTAVPVVTLGSVGSGTLAGPLARMTLISATVATGGAGCTTGTQTFALSGGSPITAATATGVVAAGAVSGTITVVVPGTYINLPTTVSAVTVTGGGCSTAPTLNASFGIGSIYMAGTGVGYPSGVTASVTGTGTVGTPVISFPVAPLTTTISAFTSATQVTLAANAATAVATVAGNVVWGTNDTTAFTSALTYANAQAAALATRGFRRNLYVPPGNYWLSSALTQITNNTGVLGDGVGISRLYVAPSMSGDLFSWDDAWISSSNGGLGGATIQANAKSNVNLRGIHVVGNRLSPNIQNAFVFWDHTDFLTMERVQVETLHGRAFYAGAILNDADSYIRESHFRDLRFFGVGAPGYPVFEITSNSVSEGSNSNYLNGIEIYAPYDTGIWIHGVLAGARLFYGDNIRIEGIESGGVGADLLKIGDSNNIITQQMMFSQLALLDPYEGYAAVHVTSGGSGFVPYGIVMSGEIGGGVPYGRGLQLDFSRSSSYAFQLISTSDINVTLGANSGANLITGWGAERGWTWSIDSGSATTTYSPVLAAGTPGTASGLNLGWLGSIGNMTVAASGSLGAALSVPNGSNFVIGPVSNTSGGTLNATANTVINGGLTVGNGALTPYIKGASSVPVQFQSPLIVGQTKFTTSGCSISATTGSGTVGTYTSGTSGTCTAVITMNGATGGMTATNGWNCTANDWTTPADAQAQTATSTTTATIAGTTVSGDVIHFSCQAY